MPITDQWPVSIPMLRLPDLDLSSLTPPFEGFFVGGEIEINVLALDSSTDILDTSPAIAWNMHNGAEGVEVGVRGDRTPVHARA